MKDLQIVIDKKLPQKKQILYILPIMPNLFLLLLLSLTSCSLWKEAQPDVEKKVLNKEDQAICICMEIYRPVCGKDGVTYANSCQAECKKMSFKEGACLDY